MKFKSQLSIAALMVAGLFATGCSQQSVGGSQVAGGSQSQIEGGSQMAGGQASSQQQVEAPVVAAPVAAAPAKPMGGNCHTHPANALTKTIRHCHPNPTGVHRYGGAKKRVAHGNRWTHTHPAIPHCTNSIRHTHKYKNRNHTHRYSCRGMRHAAPARPEVDVYALQRKLKAKGYYKGPIDGVVGPGTRSALKRFMNR